jgi:hypothetical protein
LQSRNLTAFHKIIIVQKRILPIAITAITFISLIGWNCTKLDTTDIGGDQLPAVDNVHTFADTLLINSTQGIFNDTTKVDLNADFVLGAINNDNLFGKTNGSIYLQLKPKFYPFYFGNERDTISGSPDVGLDSVVLCLKYKGFWGDSALPVQLNVLEVKDKRFNDSVFEQHNINYAPTTTTFLTSKTIDIRRLGDTVKYANRRDYSINLIRIKLPMAWAQSLFNRDSTSNPLNNAFSLDSVFREFYNGLAVVPAGGGSNSLVYVNLADTSTKLEIHFRKRNKGIVDTTFQSFVLNRRISPPGTAEPARSSVANYIVRNRSGSAMATPAAGELYVQTTPGSYINLNIPALSTLNNRIIHRAEIIIQQIPDNTFLDETMSAPALLYLDLRDTTVAQKWKPIYYDLNPNESYNPDSQTGFNYLPSTINYLSFGGYRRDGKDKFGNAIKYYNINISRYIQQLVTKHTPNYNMRLYAPYEIFYPQLGTSTDPAFPTAYGNNLAAGRVKIGGGSNANYKMILRIIYSKL